MQRWWNQRDVLRARVIPSKPSRSGKRTPPVSRTVAGNICQTASSSLVVRYTPLPSSPAFTGGGHLFASPVGFATLAGVTLAGFAQAGLRRLFRRRARNIRRAISRMEDGSLKFSVATFNLRGIMDRWAERRPLLQRCLEEMDADVVCFQECLTGEYGQDRSLLGTAYHIFPCKAALFHLLASGNAFLRSYARAIAGLLSIRPLQRLMIAAPAPLEALRERMRLQAAPFRALRDLTIAPFFGNSVACRLAEAHEIKHSTLLLGDWRAAQRIEFNILGDESSKSEEVNTEHGTKVWIVNTHLDHAHPDNRQKQAMEVAKWMEQARQEVAVVVLCGDFNGAPYEPFHAALRALGYKSGYLMCHGKEPLATWPTGIQAPLMDYGEAECLDYVYVWVADSYELSITDAAVFGDKPDPKDPTLYPSDHAAVKITLRLKRRIQ